MIERDFFMRQIQLLAQVLSKILLHKKVLEFPQARREIESAYKSFFGVGGEFVRQFSAEQLIEMVGKDVETASVQWYTLGALLKEEAEIQKLEGSEDESLLSSQKALSLVLTAFNDLGMPMEPDHPQKIVESVERLRGIEIANGVKEKLFRFYEITNKYDKAEDILFELMQTDSRFVEAGIAFYERLLKLSNEELAKGGLPRHEVIEAVESLRAQRGQP